MPECQHYEELISAYLDGELSSHEEEVLRAHLASCPKCAALLDTYKLLFGKTPVVKAPAGFAASVMGMTAIFLSTKTLFTYVYVFNNSVFVFSGLSTILP